MRAFLLAFDFRAGDMVYVVPLKGGTPTGNPMSANSAIAARDSVNNCGSAKSAGLACRDNAARSSRAADNKAHLSANPPGASRRAALASTPAQA